MKDGNCQRGKAEPCMQEQCFGSVRPGSRGNAWHCWIDRLLFEQACTHIAAHRRKLCHSSQIGNSAGLFHVMTSRTQPVTPSVTSASPRSVRDSIDCSRLVPGWFLLPIWVWVGYPKEMNCARAGKEKGRQCEGLLMATTS